MLFTAVVEKLRGKADLKKVSEDSESQNWCAIKKAPSEELEMNLKCLMEGTALGFRNNRLHVISKTLGMDASERLARAFNELIGAIHRSGGGKSMKIEVITKEETSTADKYEMRTRTIDVRLDGRFYEIQVMDPIGAALLKSNVSVTEIVYAQPGNE